MSCRHLSREQKRALIAESLKADPQMSNNIHAERTGASDVTVQAVRDELVATSQIEKFEKLRGKDGKERPAKYGPASQPSRPEPEPEPEPDGEEDTPAPTWEPAGQLHPAASPVETTKRPNLGSTTQTGP